MKISLHTFNNTFVLLIKNCNCVFSDVCSRLQRAIDEHSRSSSFANLRCEQHPDDAASLYCKTCEKSICLKCFFSNKGQSVHNDHDVDTSEDAFSQEMVLVDSYLLTLKNTIIV